jgi:hypothetical protein
VRSAPWLLKKHRAIPGSEAKESTLVDPFNLYQRVQCLEPTNSLAARAHLLDFPRCDWCALCCTLCATTSGGFRCNW